MQAYMIMMALRPLCLSKIHAALLSNYHPHSLLLLT